MPLPPSSLFDHRQLRRQRLRAAPCFADHDFLFREAALRLADRLLDIKRDFPLALELGSRGGLMGVALQGQGRVKQLIGLDLDPALLEPDRLGVVADLGLPPFTDRSFDLVLSCLSLHWVDDLPGLLVQVRRMLKPGGLFLASLLGGNSLAELRESLLLAESEISGGAAPRVIPMADIKDLGGLLRRAGFEQPVADAETLTAEYPNPLSLLADLRGMGEANALIKRSKKPLSRAVLMRMAEIYQERFAGPQGRVTARFDILTLTGWTSPEGG